MFLIVMYFYLCYSWSLCRGDHFDISISAHDTVDTVKRKIEEVAEDFVGDGEYR